MSELDLSGEAELTAKVGFYFGHGRQLSQIFEDESQLQPEYMSLRERLTHLDEAYSMKLSEIMRGLAEGAKDPVTKLSMLLDSRDSKAVEKLLDYNVDLFDDLGFVAELIVEVIKKKDIPSAKQLLQVLSSDYTVIDGQLQALASYLRVVDEGIDNKEADICSLLHAEGMNPPKALMGAQDAQPQLMVSYTSKTQGNLYRVLALKAILKRL